ncbi:MAG: hypothetical protein AAGK78_02085, partial [Planctomycetota bacterium]
MRSLNTVATRRVALQNRAGGDFVERVPAVILASRVAMVAGRVCSGRNAMSQFAFRRTGTGALAFVC